MGKKINSFIISTLIALSGSSALSIPAYADEESTKNYWTISELLAVKPEMDATKDNFCGNNWECRQGINMAYRGLKGRYGGEAEIEDMRFLITSVNPSAGTIRVLFFDENLDYSTWTAEHYNLTELYLYWIDEGMQSPATNGTFHYTYTNKIRNNEADPGLHVIIAENETNRFPGWFTANQEVVYSSDDLSSIFRSEIHVYMNSESGNMLGTTNFRDCIESADYHEGMECRRVYDESINWFRFIPLDPAEAFESNYSQNNNSITEDIILDFNDNNDTTQDIITAKQNTNLDIDSTQENTVTDQENDGLLSVSTDDEKHINQVKLGIASLSSTDETKKEGTTAIAAIGAPDTGAIIEEESLIELPWWLAFILALGGITLIWLFSPLCRKNHKNNQKSNIRRELLKETKNSIKKY